MKNDLIEKVTYLIERDELNKRNRNRDIIYKKCYLMHRLRKEPLTFSEIGAFFNQHHASVIHNIQTHKDMMKYNKDQYTKVIREYEVFLHKAAFVLEPRDIFNDVMDCTNQYKLNRVKKWIEQGRYINLQEDATILEN
jgi:hypothetical protein